MNPRQDQLGHPYQLQLVAGLIAQEYAPADRYFLILENDCGLLREMVCCRQ